MTSLSTVVFFVAVIAMAAARIPDKYVLKVTPVCGNDVQDDARIEIVTDLVIWAQAECAGGTLANFTTTDDVNFVLMLSYPNQGVQQCVFKKKAHTLVFHVKVSVAYGEKPGLIHMNEEIYTVTCSFSPHGSNGSPEQSIIEGLIAPPELLINVGGDSNSTITLEMVNVLGQSLANENVHLGRTVQLRGVSKAEDGEVGIRPVQCFAMDGDTKYAILRAGCGDGIVFPKDCGFTTNGTTTLSPYFEAFSIDFAPVIKFKCLFVTCMNDCNGSSCESEARRRRDASNILQQEKSDSKLIRSQTISFYGAQPPETLAGRNRR